MHIIIGLGNPEDEYKNTRHNMGFCAIDEIAKNNQIQVTKKGFKSIYGIGKIEEEKVILVKPQTYMNLSGEAVKEIIQFYKIPLENLLIIYDDIDIIPGSIKLRKKGGPGTHNGMKSIVNSINTQDFPRIRIGIGTPKEKDLIYHVIGPIPDEAKEQLKKGIELASKATEEYIKNGIDIAMNKYN